MQGRRHNRLRHIALWMVVALILAACAPGGGDAEAPDTTQAPATTEAATDTTAAETPDTTADEETPDTTGGAEGTVKVGFISPTTGFVAALGTDMQRGWNMYWEQNGNTVNGVTVETVFEDDAGDPDVALTKARRLVEEEQVDIVAGPILANTAYAVAEYVAGQGIPSFHITAADDITQRDYDPHVLRVGYGSSQTNFPAGQWAFDQGYQTAVTICPDYAFGWESCGGFVSAFTESGGEILEQIWHPLGNQDFSTYVTQIQSASPDVVFVGSAGGADAIGAVQSFTYWVEGREDDEVQAFVSAYEEAHGEIPSLYAAGSYMMAQVVAEALKTTGGEVNGAEFVEAARGVSLENSLYGPLEFDDYNNVVGPVYQTEIVDRGDGTLWAVVAETFDDVSQFWNKTPEEYMENPVFTRDYQGN